MSLFFWLFTFAINVWHQKFITADVTAAFVNKTTINMVFSDEDKILIKKSLCLETYTAKEHIIARTAVS